MAQPSETLAVIASENITSSPTLEIKKKLKNTKEQKEVVGPLVEYLCGFGWELDQIVFGKKEWYVPKTPSDASEREKRRSFAGFPCDIAIFDTPARVSNPRHLIVIIECKQPTEQAGVSQLEIYLSREPHVRLGVWVNNADPTAPAVFVYRQPNGTFLIKRRYVVDLPRPGEKISPKSQKLTYKDMIVPSSEALKKRFEDLLDKIVARDTKVTRREEQLDQLCNLILLKLESDKQARSDPDTPPFFRPLESAHKTAEEVTRRYSKFVQIYPDVFLEAKDKEIRFNEETVYACVEELSRLRLLDLEVTTVSLGFQILRSAALKQGEGQYFTPQPVIEAGVRLMQVGLDDLVIDPACGTGGFLVQTVQQLTRDFPQMSFTDISRWAQTHVFGIDKDAIGVKLTKAIMQVFGDGSANTVRGDSVRTHNWSRDFQHLLGGKFDNNRFTVVITNPPFGNNLKVSAEDARLAGLDIANIRGQYQDLEIGLLFLNRAYQLLRKGGRVGIVLPETYFFSSNYQFIFEWLKNRLRPRLVVNIPMEAFQGFCRAKTNFYVFEKVG